MVINPESIISVYRNQRIPNVSSFAFKVNFSWKTVLNLLASLQPQPFRDC